MSKLLIKLALKKAKSEREALGILSGIFGIICNTLLCIFKFVIGSISGSVSITADAVNNLSDAGSGIITILGSKLANKPTDEEHPFGHGRFEYITALAVSFLIFLMSFELGKNSVIKIINPSEISFSIWYITALAAAIGIKLYMAFFNNVLYKKTDNLNLKAVKQDSMNDCIATAATIAALLISAFTPIKRADGIIGLIVAVIIFCSGVGIVRDITGKILGNAPSKKLVSSIENIILEEELILGVHDLIVHDYGPGRIIASAHAEVPSDADIVEIHDVIDSVEKRISKELRIVICIHMDPIVIDDEDVDHYKKLTESIIKSINENYSFHEFRLIKGKTNTLLFDLVVPYDKKTTADILNELKYEYKKIDSSVNLIVTIEHSYV